MRCPEPSEAAQDTAYCEYLSGYSSGPAGFLMLIAGLDRIYEAMDKDEEKNE